MMGKKKKMVVESARSEGNLRKMYFVIKTLCFILS